MGVVLTEYDLEFLRSCVDDSIERWGLEIRHASIKDKLEKMQIELKLEKYNHDCETCHLSFCDKDSLQTPCYWCSRGYGSRWEQRMWVDTRIKIKIQPPTGSERSAWARAVPKIIRAMTSGDNMAWLELLRLASYDPLDIFEKAMLVAKTQDAKMWAIENYNVIADAIGRVIEVYTEDQIGKGCLNGRKSEGS